MPEQVPSNPSSNEVFMDQAKDIKEYYGQITQALQNEFQRKALDAFAVAYRPGRTKAFADQDLESLRDQIGRCKDAAIADMDRLYQKFKDQAEQKGAHIHLARTDREANALIAQIARENDCQNIVKSKSMTAEETQLNSYLAGQGLQVTETDLGDWIIQLRQERQSHMVLPAIHLSKGQVSDLFSRVTGQEQDEDIGRLVKVARRELRQRFVQADMGITGANFALADSGTLGLVTNEGNARLVSTLPRVHVCLVGLDKLTPGLEQALTTLRGLPRNATAQSITSYVTWITGATECQSAADQKKELHIVFLDNGRKALAKDPVFSQALRCVHCGGCANVCPVYRMVGGHAYGHIYIGAIGLIMTYFFHGKSNDRYLVQNCLNCQACKDVCIARINLPRLIKEVQILIQDQEKHPLFNQMTATILKNRRLFHSLLRSAKTLQKPISWGSPYLRHMPFFLLKGQEFKALPALAAKPFRSRWKKIKPKPAKAKYTVALFSGCLQDFVYPEQLEYCVQILAAHNVAIEFPLEQGCCGLPAYMLGEKECAREIALHNVSHIDPPQYDYILTLCASCGSHLKENYPYLAGEQLGLQVKVQQFSDKIIDLSSFLYHVLGLRSEVFAPAAQEKTAYHAPCHLCRGLGVATAPRELMREAGIDYQHNREEENCCGLGGTYSLKFPEVSKEIVNYKLNHLEENNFTQLVTDCPGCIMQLRGTAEKRQSPIKVVHMVEALHARVLKT